MSEWKRGGLNNKAQPSDQMTQNFREVDEPVRWISLKSLLLAAERFDCSGSFVSGTAAGPAYSVFRVSGKPGNNKASVFLSDSILLYYSSRHSSGWTASGCIRNPKPGRQAEPGSQSESGQKHDTLLLSSSRAERNVQV